MKINKIATIILVAAMVTSLAACGQSQGAVSTESSKSESLAVQKPAAFPGTKQADTVVLDITAEPMELSPLKVYDAVSTDILSHCMSGLTKLDKNDQPVADLAERWEINEDNTVYKIFLRKDAKWSNGDLVTANDFYFSWISQLKPDTGSYMAAFLYENIKGAEDFYGGKGDETSLGIKVIDDYTIEIEWNRPKSDGLFLLALPTYFPVNQKAYEEIGEAEYAKEADKMVTNGAYNLTKWVHDDHLMLEKSETYYGAKGISIPKVKLVMLSDANTRLNAFMTGAIDLCNLYSEQIPQVKEKDENAVKSFVDGGSWYISFNMAHPQLSNANLRRALSNAIDIQSLLDNVIADGSVAADGLVPSTISGVGGKSYAQARGSLFAANKEKAKEYFALALKELNITKEELKLTLDIANTSYSKNQAEYIQQEWKKNLGVDVTVNAQEWGAVQEAKWNGDFNIGIEANGASENSAMSFLGTFTSDSSNNLFKFENSEYDIIIEKANNEGDEAKKQELLIKAEKILIDEMAIGPMYFTCTTYAISNKLSGLVRTPFQYFNVYEGAQIK